MTPDPARDPQLLTRDDVLALVAEVAAELPESLDQQRIVLVGGALLALDGLREATRDLDSVTPLSPQVQAAVLLVARRHGLSPHWLNDRAAAFRPQSMDATNGELLLDHPRLQLVGPPRREVS